MITRFSLCLLGCLAAAPAVAECLDDDDVGYNPRRSHESWGDYYERKQEQVEQQFRSQDRDDRDDRGRRHR